ncbi:MAG: HAD family hydrolase [Chlorobiaceae bacterium]|nr:HAD family hydrolase [Chlorobiaceae bacterium]NTW73555.1 HAD family hydrolase [Chlorobiaceae bacterium]
MNLHPPGPFRAVLFDLDGTLLDTLEDIAFSLNAVLERHGYPTHTLKECRELVGFGMEALVESALPEHARNESVVVPLLEEMKTSYANHWNENSKPYDGIGLLLDAIDRKGLQKVILSNKPDLFTKLCADELLKPWRFDVVMGHHREIAHKPDPQGALLLAGMLGVQPSEVLYVGDSGIDMKTACAAGMYPMGVLWGFRPERELREMGAAWLANTPEEIIDFLELARQA